MALRNGFMSHRLRWVIDLDNAGALALPLVKRRAYTLNDIRTNAASFQRLGKKLNAFLPKIPASK
jgi:hypothetical protein